MMDAVSAEAFLQDQIPLAARVMIAPTLKTACAAVRLMVDQEPILNIVSAEDNRGRLISWAVDHAFEKLLKTKQWPYDFRWKDFARPTGRYLEVRLSHSLLAISQVADPNKQPRNVVFRANARITNAPFFDLPEFDDTRAAHGLPHFLMIHGHQSLRFAHLAVPHALHHRDWLYRTPNLMTSPHVVPLDVPPTEDTEFEAVMMLKEEIEKTSRDHAK